MTAAPTEINARAQLAYELRCRAEPIARAKKVRAANLSSSDGAHAVMAALWPDAPPHEVGQAKWWRTALGRLCAKGLSDDAAMAVPVTHAVAAEILGVQRNAVGQYVTKGYLTRMAGQSVRGHAANGEGGVRTGEGISLASVLARVAR